MEMHHVRYFLAVADTLNFTRAADRCNVSQPSLTRAVQALEDELGGALFRRERNQTHLTELGRLMRPYMAEVQLQADEAKSRAKGYVGLKDSPLTLGIMCTIGPAKLLELLRRFRRNNPGVSVNIRDARGQLLQEWLVNGELDIAVYGLPDELDDRLYAKLLFSERFVIVVDPEHRFAAMNAVPLRELHEERYLARINCEFADHVATIARGLGVQTRQPYRSERDDWILAMVKAGFGFGFFPEYAVDAEGLECRPLVDPEITRAINVVTVRGRPHSPAVGAFVRETAAFKW